MKFFRRSQLLLALCLSSASPALRPQDAQESSVPDEPSTVLPPSTRDALAKATPEARKAWEAMCKASVGAAEEPITAFHLEAKTRLRDGAQRNDAKVSYRFLAPDLVRFSFESQRELGRFGTSRREYWTKEKDEVILLESRNYEADRRTIEEMAILARNYIALSAPERLRITELRLLDEAPSELRFTPSMARQARQLVWISVESPDFALLGTEDAARPQPSYRIDFGLRDPERTDSQPTDGASPAWTPALALVRGQAAPGRRARQAVLLRLEDYRRQDGYHIPFFLAIHHLVDGPYARFQEEPAQEAGILRANLRPKLTREDFRP